MFTYNFVHKREQEDSPPIPFFTFFSNDHHEFEIIHCLARLKVRYTNVTHSERMPIDVVVTDLSWALSNSVLNQFCGMSLMQYLRACVEAKRKRTVKFVLLCWCYTHLINASKIRISKLVPVATKPFSPARKFFKNLMATMARTTEIEDALDIFRLAVVILESQNFTDRVRQAVGSIALRYDQDYTYQTTTSQVCDSYYEQSYTPRKTSLSFHFEKSFRCSRGNFDFDIEMNSVNSRVFPKLNGFQLNKANIYHYKLIYQEAEM